MTIRSYTRFCKGLSEMNDKIEIFSQIIGDTIEQNLRVLQAQRGFVFDSGFQESKKSSPSQVLGCGYGLM